MILTMRWWDHTLTILRSQRAGGGAATAMLWTPKGGFGTRTSTIVVPFIRRNAFHKAARCNCIYHETHGIDFQVVESASRNAW